MVRTGDGLINRIEWRSWIAKSGIIWIQWFHNEWCTMETRGCGFTMGDKR